MVESSKPERLYLAMGAAQGFLWAPWGLAAMGWWVVDLAFSPIQLVALGTVLELAVLLSESPTGAVADVFSRKWSIVVSWILMGVAAFASPFNDSLWTLLAWQALWGFGYTFQSGADTAWVTDEIGREDDRLIMRHAIWRLVGVLVGLGCALFALVVLDVGITSVMIVAGLGNIAFGLVMAAIMPESNFEPADRSERSSSRAVADTWRQGLALIRDSRILRIIVVVTVLISMSDEVVDRLDLVRLVELGAPALNGADTAIWFGFAWMGLTLLTMPLMIWINRGSHHLSDGATARSLAALLVLGGFGILAMSTSWIVVAVIGWAARDTVREVTAPMMSGWVNRHAETSVRATALSFNSQAMAAGEIGGGLALGALAEFIPLWMVFAVAGLLYLFAGAITRSGRSETPLG